jgi:aspartyl protease family protein
MSRILFAVVIGAMLLLVVLHDQGMVMGLPIEDVGHGVYASIIALALAGWVVSESRGRWRQALVALVAWIAIGLALIAGYAYRDDLAVVVDRVRGELAPGSAIETGAREVTLSRRGDGHFMAQVKLDGTTGRMMVDTGASTVVLTAETAKAMGIRPETLRFDQPVSTANGRTTAAAVRIGRLSIGPIEERNVPALVAQPGALRENLLGLSFLDRLESYEVRGSRMVMRGR